MPEWLVVSKPAGWHSVAQGDPDQPCVIEHWLRNAVAESAALHQAGLVHRLDVGTSGCLVAARTETRRQQLRAAFGGSGGGVEKVYLCKVSRPLAPTGSLTRSFTSRHKGSAKVTVSECGDAATRGAIRWRTVGGEGTIAEVRIEGPGRRHQIRAALASIGSPLVGDALYGGVAHEGGWPLLHAWVVGIDGWRIQSPPPRWARE